MVLVLVSDSGLKGLGVDSDSDTEQGLEDSARDRAQDRLTIFKWILSTFFYFIVKIKHLTSHLFCLHFVYLYFAVLTLFVFDWDILFSR